MPTLQDLIDDVNRGDTVIRGRIAQADDGTDYYVDTSGNAVILGDGAGSISGAVFYTTVAAMTADSGNITNGDVVFTEEYSSGSGGGNSYKFHSTGRSGETMDEGFYIAGDGADDYFEALDKGQIEPFKFGVVEGSDQGTELQALLDQASSGQIPIHWGSYNFQSASDLIFNTNCSILGMEGSGSSFNSRLTLTGDARLVFHGTDGIGTDWSFQNSIRNLRIVPESSRTARAVTVDSGTDTFTLTAHGFTDDTRVFLDGTALPSGVTGLLAGTKSIPYHVTNATANTFQLVLRIGETAVSLSDNGTAVTVTLDEVIRVGQAYWCDFDHVVMFDSPYGCVNVSGGNHNRFARMILDGTGSTAGGTGDCVNLSAGASVWESPSVQFASRGFHFLGGNHALNNIYVERTFDGIRTNNGTGSDRESLDSLSVHGGVIKQQNASVGISIYNSENVLFSGINTEWDAGDNFGNFVYATNCVNVRVTGMPREQWIRQDNGLPSGSTNLIAFDDIPAFRARTSNYTATESDSDTLMTNEGAAGTVTITLPPAAEGMVYSFARIASQAFRADPDGTEIIGTGTAGQYIELQTDNSELQLRCYAAGSWVISKSTGTTAYG